MTGVAPTLHHIVYQPLDREYEANRFEDFIRVPVTEALLVEGHGIQGDQKAGHNPKRHLNVLSREWLDSLKPHGYRTEPGQFGEQLIVGGIDVAALEPGDRLTIGDNAMIEITKARTGCSRLQAAQGRSMEVTGGSIGMLARVVAGGVIRVGDRVGVVRRVEVEG